MSNSNWKEAAANERDKLKAEIVNREGEKQEMREVIDGLKAEFDDLERYSASSILEIGRLKIDLERERAANAKLRSYVALIRSEYMSLPCDIDMQQADALLAAKQDEGNG